MGTRLSPCSRAELLSRQHNARDSVQAAEGRRTRLATCVR